jgi:2-dehydropantoate 2-reductase
MVNNPEGSKEYLQHVSTERLIIGFPGAGGEIEGGVVHGHIVSGLIQPTTIGKTGANNQSGLIELKKILNAAGFPVSINRNMDSWLLNHLAMVCPLGNAIYAAGGDNYTASKNHAVMKNTVLALKEAFLFLKRSGVGINPATNYLFICCPTFMLTFILRLVYNTRWAATVIANHSLNARTEMSLLSDGFIRIAVKKQKRIPYFEELASFNGKG